MEEKMAHTLAKCITFGYDLSNAVIVKRMLEIGIGQTPPPNTDERINMRVLPSFQS